MAVELGEAVQARAANVLSELRVRAERQAPRAKVTWVMPDRLHLTLRFIGEADDRQVERVIGAMRDPIRSAPFAVRWEELGAFPRKGPPRVLWIGVAEGTDALMSIEAAVSDRLFALGIPKEDRPYSPHLTLARVRDAANLRAQALFEGLSARLGTTRVDAITLFQSKLSPKGPTYIALERTAVRSA